MPREFTPFPGRFLPRWDVGDYCHPGFLRHIDRSSVHTIVEAGCADAMDTRRLVRQFPGTVHAFEANPDVLIQTRRNCAGEPRIKLVEKAVWDSDGWIPFFPVVAAADYDTGVNPGASSCFQARPEYVGRYIQKRVIVESIRLDTYCASQGITAIDLLCIDVQGATLQVLKGLADLIEGVQHVIAEIEVRPIYYGQALYPEVHACLKSKGFRQAAEVIRGGWFSDYLYTRKPGAVAVRSSGLGRIHAPVTTDFKHTERCPSG
jgi:FkbM family methyltransferase